MEPFIEENDAALRERRPLKAIVINLIGKKGDAREVAISSETIATIIELLNGRRSGYVF